MSDKNTTGILDLHAGPLFLRYPSDSRTLRLGLRLLAETQFEDRPPLTVTLALDRSSSMDGEPLTHVKHAAESIIDALRPDDRVGLVPFDARVERAIPPSELDQVHRVTLKRTIRRLDCGYGTNLQAAMEYAYKTMPERRTHERQLVVLLTDGHPSRGERSAEGLAALADKREGMPATSVLGFGQHFWPDVVTEIAQAGGGQSRYVPEPTDTLRVFAEVIGHHTLLVADDVRLMLTPTPDVEIARIYTGQSVEETPLGEHHIEVQPLTDSDVITAGIVLETEAADAGWRDLVDIELSYADMSTRQRIRRSMVVGADYSPLVEPAEPDAERVIDFADARMAVAVRAVGLQVALNDLPAANESLEQAREDIEELRSCLGDETDAFATIVDQLDMERVRLDSLQADPDEYSREQVDRETTAITGLSDISEQRERASMVILSDSESRLRSHRAYADEPRGPGEPVGVIWLVRVDGELIAMLEPPDIVLLGRSSSNHIQLDDPSVSNVHAAVECRGDGIEIVDADSTNGTEYGGQEIRRTILEPGVHAVWFGEAEVVFESANRYTR